MRTPRSSVETYVDCRSRPGAAGAAPACGGLAAALIALLALAGPARGADPLAPASCASSTDATHHYSINQIYDFWAAVAVNPAPGDDKDVGVWAGPDGTGTALAVSARSSGTDFCVGDFNDTPTGTYYPSVYAPSTGSWVVEWESGDDAMAMDRSITGTVGGGTGDCGLVRVVDISLDAGVTYEFQVVPVYGTSTDPQIGLALFRNPGQGTYWAGRSESEFEIVAPSSTRYTAPTSDWYGLVVFNDSPGSPLGAYEVYVSEVLEFGQCVERSYVPYAFSFEQQTRKWTGVGINPAPGDDKDLALFSGPMGSGNLLAYSERSVGTDFLVANFNPQPPGWSQRFYAQVTQELQLSPFVVEWGADGSVLSPALMSTGTLGGASGDCGLLHVANTDLQVGSDYAFTLWPQGQADIRLVLFRDSGPAGSWYPRSGSEFEVGGGETPHVYTVPADGTYGIVVFNDSPGSLPGSYNLGMAEGLQSGAGALRDLSPYAWFIDQSDIYWTVVGVISQPGDDKDLRLLTGPNLTGTLLAESNLASGADFVVGDFNHNATGSYYPWVSGGGPTPFSTQWDSGSDILRLGVPVSGTLGGSAGDVVRIWDAQLEAGQDYRLTLTGGGPGEARVALFRNPANAAYWAGRAAAELDRAAGETPVDYSAAAGDWYGVVVFNDTPGAAGTSYELLLDLATPVELTSFEAAVDGDGPGTVTLRWTTGGEENVLGFHVLRAASREIAAAERITPALILAGRDAYAFTDRDPPPGAAWYWLEETTRAGETLRYGPRQVAVPVVPPAFFARAVPNPCRRGGAAIDFSIPAAAPVDLRLYSISGRLVRALVSGQLLAAGERRVAWDGRDARGAEVASGVYVYRLEAAGRRLEGKLQVLR